MTIGRACVSAEGWRCGLGWTRVSQLEPLFRIAGRAVRLMTHPDLRQRGRRAALGWAITRCVGYVASIGPAGGYALLLLASCEAKPGKLQVLKADVGVRQQIRFMVCGGEQLRWHGTTGDQAGVLDASVRDS